MIASNSIVFPIRGGSLGICSCPVCCMLNSMLQKHYSNHPSGAAAYTCLRVDGQRCTLARLFKSSANAAPVSVQALPVQCRYNTGTDVGRGSLETTGNRVLDIIGRIYKASLRLV